jgi:hypothetical protein
MNAVKPPILPPVAPPVAQPAQQPGRTDAAGNAFQPGLEARSAPAAKTVQPNQPSPASESAATAAPAGETRQHFTLQALSAYAGALINDMGSDPATPPAQTPSRARTSVAESPPPKPGGLLDLKV